MNMMDLFKSCLGKIRNIRKGFTLTEILIALAVIAIIVVLVLPVVTSRAQNKSFALAYDAEVKEIFSSLEGLTLNENAKSFNDTMMNVSTEIAEGANAEEVASSALNGLTDTNPGLFLKKYTKVAKYCGATPGTCFAQAYFRYNGRRRGNFDFANIVTGNGNATYRVRGNENDLRYDNMACALLKNGMSLCISPQVTATNGDVLRPVRGFIDLNGPKEPNVLGRDLRSFSMDLSTRQIASVEAAEVVNPEGPVACQDGECCEQRHNSGDLQQNDACCNTLIAEYGWDDGVTLQYCCNASHATKDDACCQKLYNELGDGAPAQCKPDEEKTACEKYGEGDATQLVACCSDRGDEYWDEHDWDTLCCDADAFKTQCCNDNSAYRNAHLEACCELTGSTAPECDTCSEANWTDNCCSTVSHDTDLWKNKCCSKAEYANTAACCSKTQDGINGANVFDRACCGQATQTNEACCNAAWKDGCCQVISSDAARRSNDQWQDKCCSDSEFANKDYCCKDDEGTAGDGTKKAICCSNEKTYTFEHTCCKDFGIGCPASCENDDYFEKNLTQCCKEKPDDERCSCSTKWVSNAVCCPGANSTDFLKHNCCKDVPDDVKCCTQDGENGGGRISEVCCKQPGLSKRGIEWCCEDGFLEGDICGNPNCEENHITLVKTERAEQGMQVPTHYTDLKIKSERPVEVAQNVIVKYTIHHYKNQSKEPYEQIETSVEDKQDTLTIGVGEKESKTLTLWTRDCPGFGPGCDPQQYTEIKSITVSKDHDDACYPYSDEPSGGGTCSDYASDRTNPKWTELSCCTKDEYYNDISCCSGNKDGKGNTSLNCCKANNPSINDSEHECCAVGYDSMGCCSADSSDDGCCTYAIETKGEKLNPDHICCSSNKYKNDPRCMTPCQKVENGTNSIADTKACCDEKGNAYWTSNNWAQTCCLNVFDNQGYYAYRGEAQCCPYIKDNGGLLTCYGPSHPEQCCSSLDKNACTGKGISSSDACWNTCYKADGTPDTSKGVVCCSIWNNDGKLNDNPDLTALCGGCGAPNTDKANTVCCKEWGTSQVANNEEVMGLCCASLKGTDTSWSQLCCQPDEVSHTCCHANLGTGNGGKAASDASLRAYACECCKESGWLNAGNITWCRENCPSCQEPDSSRVSEACCKFWQDSGKLEKAGGSVKNACCNIQGFRYYNYNFAEAKSPYCATNTDYVCNNNLSWDVNIQYDTNGWGSIYSGVGPRLVKLNLNGEKMCRGRNVLKFIIDSSHRRDACSFAGKTFCTGVFYADGTDCGHAPITVFNNSTNVNCEGFWPLEYVPGIPNPTCRVYNNITGALVSEECRGSYLYQEKMYGYNYLYCYPNCP